MSTLAVVGLGANLGDAEATVRLAIEAVASLSETHLREASRLYRTPAWGQTEQPDFINAVALLDTTLAPRRLLDDLLSIEREFGRTRSAGERWGPRTLDLDLLLYGDLVIDEPGLRVPHPHLHERAFAVLPLAQIAPGLHIPGIGTVAGVAATLAGDGIQALP